jgi:hypothetical protein
MSEGRCPGDLAFVNRFFEGDEALGEVIHFGVLSNAREKSNLFDLILIKDLLKHCVKNIRADSSWKICLLKRLLRRRLILQVVCQYKGADLSGVIQLEVLIILVEVLHCLIFI